MTTSHLFTRLLLTPFRAKHRSLSSSLLVYVLLGAFVGLGLVSLLLLQMLEKQLREQIQGNLSTKVKSVEVEVVQVKQAVHDLSAAVRALDEQGVDDPDTYKFLVFHLFERRSNLMTGFGFGQAPFEIVPDREEFWPYFSIDQQAPDQRREKLPPPHDYMFYFDVSQDQYLQKFYYLDVIKAGKGIWLEPYEWYGNTITTYTEPIWNDTEEVIGVAGLDMNITEINQLLGTSVIADTGHFVLLSAKGNLLSYSPDPEKARKLTNYQSIPYLQRVWPQIATKVHSQSGIIRVDNTYLAYQKIQETDWIVLAVVPQFKVLAPVITIILGGALLAGALLTGIVSLFTKKLNTRLQPIVDRCQQLSSRQLTGLTGQPTEAIGSAALKASPTAEQNADEIGILEDTVEYMAAQLTATLASLEDRVMERTQELSQALQTLQTTQAQLIQSEKISGLGQMVAGVAHEINNPNNFIHGNIKYLEDCFQDLLLLLERYLAELPQIPPHLQQELDDLDLPFMQEDLPKVFSSMRSGTERIRTIIQSLRSFSRLDEAALKFVNLHDCLDSTLVILGSRLNSKRSDISVVKDYAVGLPEVECYVGELNQAFFNIIANAIDVMEQDDCNPHTLEIKTAQQKNDWITIYISDTGAGISDEIRSRIFDPFFTTKPVGKGTGLGLTVSYQIVTERHSGKLSCDSIPGKGTKFCIEIPLKQTKA